MPTTMRSATPSASSPARCRARRGRSWCRRLVEVGAAGEVARHDAQQHALAQAAQRRLSAASSSSPAPASAADHRLARERLRAPELRGQLGPRGKARARRSANASEFASRIRHLRVECDSDAERERSFHHEAAAGERSRFSPGRCFSPSRRWCWRCASGCCPTSSATATRSSPRSRARSASRSRIGAHRGRLARPQPADQPLRRAHLRSRGREALVLPSVDNSLAWRSLVRGELRVHSLAIDGPRSARAPRRRGRAPRRRDEAPQAAGDAALHGRLGDWLLAQDEIVIRNAEIEWHDEQRGAPPLALSAAQPPPAQRAATALDRPLGAPAGRARLDASRCAPCSRGAPLPSPAAWSGRVYAELGYTDLAAWRAVDRISAGREAGPGRAARCGCTLERGRLGRPTADLALPACRAARRRACAAARSHVRAAPARRSANGRYRVAAPEARHRHRGRRQLAPSAGSPAVARTLAAACRRVRSSCRAALPQSAARRYPRAPGSRRHASTARLDRERPEAPVQYAARARFAGSP